MFQRWTKETTAKAELSNLICIERIIQKLPSHIQTRIQDQMTTDPFKMAEFVDGYLRKLDKQGDDRGMPQSLHAYVRQITTITEDRQKSSWRRTEKILANLPWRHLLTGSKTTSTRQISASEIWTSPTAPAI